MKRTLKIIGGLLGFVVIAALAAPMFISADFIKAQLTEQVKKATGRDLVIKGKASLSILPNIAVSVEDVTLGNPAGFTSPYLVHIDKLDTGAALKPLLAKELRVTGLNLKGATVHLEETKSGAKNWEFGTAKPTTDKTEASQEGAEKKSPLKALEIGTVRISDSSLHYTKPGAKSLAIEDLTLDVKGADGASPLMLDASLKYLGEGVKAKLEGGTLKAMMAGKESPLKLALDLPASSVNFNGVASLVGAPAAKGGFSFSSTSLPKLLGWATGKPAAAGLPKSVQLNAALGMKGVQDITLGDLKLAVDALKVTGNLSLKLGGAVPAIAGNLNIPELNLDTLSGKSSGGAGSGGGANGGGSGGWSNAPINASGLRAVNSNLKLAIGKLVTGNVNVANIAANVVMNGGKLNLGLGNASLYGGSAKGTVNLDGSGAGVGLGSNLTLSGIDIEALMMALSGKSKIEGRATVNLNVNGRGGSQRALVSSLGGNTSFRVNDGAIKGINVASFLRDAKQGFIFAEKTTESTDFTELTASFKLKGGVASNNDLSMKSPVLRLAGSGSINLPQRSINYRAVPTVVGTLKGQGGKDKLSSGGLAVPLIITGPWSKISVTPDLAGMITDVLKDPGAALQNLKDIKGDIGKYNSPKDIAGALLGEKKKPSGETSGTSDKPQKIKVEDAVGGLLQGLGR